MKGCGDTSNDTSGGKEKFEKRLRYCVRFTWQSSPVWELSLAVSPLKGLQGVEEDWILFD